MGLNNKKNFEISKTVNNTKSKESLIKNKILHICCMTENNVCCVCGKEHSPPDLKKIEIKGKPKQICKGCVTEIKGFA